ncbi:SDR family oxidoreductase [Streptomyces sp. JH14]|uniref:SDR family oxidoreductase n=1 Tax=Streptomyces sp. JH14 TaxID=2793630 RepID=UPI0023F8BAD9|nr:SDR family oxidoreductase [Streptomyces sp. JH14]MDF6043837.1 SDR family oxidoreductase [Streptomyces sp. JH14]
MNTDSRLDGRVIALTGAGRGLGLQITRALLDSGATVVANYRSESPALLELAEKFGDSLRLCQGDVGEEDTAERLTATARQCGRLDVLVHNAGISRDKPLVLMSPDDWDEVLRVNLRSAFLTTKQAVRVMMRQRYGRIVYISSVAAVLGNAGQANYAASKAGLHGLALTVAQEYAGYGIRSVVLAPGLLDTGLGAALPDAIRTAKAERALLGLGGGEGVAETVAFLASPAADFINAEVIRMDGGIAS